MGKEYIEREAALNAAYKIGKNEYDRGRVSNTATVMVVEDYLRAIPAADVVERKHGKWILVEDYSTEEIEDGEKYWVCSLCGCGSDSYDTTYHTNYCPNCGADMRGDDDG